MIPVLLGPEPPDFDGRVRQPGLRVLAAAGLSLSAIVSRAELMRAGGRIKPDFWRRMRHELKAVFSGCCAYSCFLLEDAITPSGDELSGSVDHFQPISRSPAGLAYEWSNLRWAWRTIDNQYKKDKVLTLDPCAISTLPFELDVGDFGRLLPQAGLDAHTRTEAEQALLILGLNQPDCVVRRRAWADDFMANAHQYGDQLMQSLQPFLWQQLKTLGAIP
ncbi:hypothetical protein [Vulcanococcus limneticus]|uniref:hypothetical protein n=1 Tax=Vulcanococcus limneticus TaxID=2170428 RepID=UPI00398BC0E4